MSLPEGEGFQRWRIGAIRVTRVVELGMPSPPAMLFEGATNALALEHEWLRPDFADEQGNLLYSIQTFVVEACGKTIVVDTCIGNDKERAIDFLSHMKTPFLERFKRAGFDPTAVDVVLCTHLHLDHVGWNTQWVDGRWTPTFPNARYLFGRRDWEDISAPRHVDPTGDVFSDSLRPIMEAGLCDLVETDHVVNEAVRLEPTPGHTPGHVSVRLQSQGCEAVITGDLIHHPLQCSEPQLYTPFCADKARSIETRRDFLARCCGADTLVIGSHFPGWTAGRVTPAGSAYRLVRAPDREIDGDQ